MKKYKSTKKKLEYARKYRLKNLQKLRVQDRDRARKKRLENPEKIRAILRKSYLKHRDRRNKESREWRKNNLEKSKANNLRWRQNNQERVKENIKKYLKELKTNPIKRQKRKEYMKNYAPEYRGKNRKKINALSRVYRKERRLYDTEFREKERLKSKSYREKNRKLVNKRERERNKKRKQNPEWVIKERERSRIRSEKLRKETPEKYRAMQERYAPRRRQHIRDKYKKDIKFKLKVRLSGRLNAALKRAITSPFQNSGKMGKTKELIGCDIDHLINHLEKKFKPKMTWDNYGPYWHVDHIIPFEYFDIKTLKGQKAACHYTNLQPLERTLNIRKSNKLIMPKKLSKIVRDNIIK